MCGHGGHCIVVRVVAWPCFVLWALSLHGCGGCHIGLCLLHGHSGCRHTALSRGCCHCVAAVGIVSHCRGGCRHTAFCIVGAIVAWLWWVSLCCVLCCRHCCCVAAVGVVSHCCGGCHCAAFCVTGTVVAWPWWASCCGRVCCVAMVGVVVLHCLAGAVIAWPWWALCHMAAVGVVSRCRSGCHHTAFCVTGAIIAWPRWASCHVAMVSVVSRCRGGYCRAVFCVAGTVVAWPWWASCCGRVCCVAAVGVIVPCCVMVRVVA